jgi:hypothetical protein
VRQSALLRLHEQGQLAPFANNRGDTEDPLARWLTALINDSPIVLSHLSASDLDVLRTATSLLTFLPLRISPKDVDRQLEHRVREAGLNLLSAGEVLGRERQLRSMLEWVANGASFSSAVMSLTGPGGSGKSAVLAEFVHRLELQDPDAVWAWLDVDSIALSKGNPIIWLTELARQLSLANADWISNSERFRVGLGVMRNQHGRHQNFDEQASSIKSLSSLWYDCWSEVMRDRRIVLILDTMEEVAVRTDEVPIVLDNWLRAMYYEYGLLNFRIVVAGRVLPELLLKNELADGTSIILGDLPKYAATRLLRRELERNRFADGKISPRAIVDKCGANPESPLVC